MKSIILLCTLALSVVNVTSQNVKSNLQQLSQKIYPKGFDNHSFGILYYNGKAVYNLRGYNGSTTEVCYPLKKLYSELSALNVESVVVFLDACFSGTTADGNSLMANARGVALRARQERPMGSLVVFSAASDDETAYPYTDRGHGLFTYYLLKKLQDSKGNATLGELSDFISENVKQRSVLINRKSQTPTVTSSSAMHDTWRKMKLKP